MCMNSDADTNLSRRKFVSTFVLSLIIGESMMDSKILFDNSLRSHSEDEFVILGGWVLLKLDLIESLG